MFGGESGYAEGATSLGYEQTVYVEDFINSHRSSRVHPVTMNISKG
jgi:hypothetical protein